MVQRLEKLKKRELVSLVLHGCSTSHECLNFCFAKVGLADIAWYEFEIRQSVWPSLVDGEKFDFERAEELIENYEVATDDLCGTVHLRLLFVEQGNQCTLEYGDIDSDFYVKLETMFAQALDALRDDPRCMTEEFETRINRICTETAGIGWGYHETLCELREKFIQDLQGHPPVVVRDAGAAGRRHRRQYFGERPAH